MALVLSALGRDRGSHAEERRFNQLCPVISTPAQSRTLRQSSFKHNSLPLCRNDCYERLLSDMLWRPRADCHLLYVVWFSVSARIDLLSDGEAEVTLIATRWGEGIAESWHSIRREKRTPNKEEYVKDRRWRGDMTVIKRRVRLGRPRAGRLLCDGDGRDLALILHAWPFCRCTPTRPLIFPLSATSQVLHTIKLFPPSFFHFVPEISCLFRREGLLILTIVSSRLKWAVLNADETSPCLKVNIYVY